MTQEFNIPAVVASIIEVMDQADPRDGNPTDEQLKRIMELSLEKGATKEDVIETFHRFLAHAEKQMKQANS